MKTENFLITGMHCASCARLVEEDARNMEGVEKAAVDFATKTLRLTYDEARFHFPDLETAVKKSGFTADRVQQAT